MKHIAYDFIVSLLIIFMVFSSGCILNNNDKNKGEIKFSAELKYEITPATNKYFYLLLPILQTGNKSIMELFDDIKTNGNGNYFFEESEYGKIINISNINKFSIQFSTTEYSKFSEIDVYKLVDFSAKSIEENKYYCYSNSTEIINLKIQFIYIYKYKPNSANERSTGTNVEIYLSGNLDKGLNLINGTINKSTE